MKIEDSISINADPARVFAVFGDLDNAVANISAMTRVEIIAGPAQLNEGTRWRESRKMFGQESTLEMWVTGYEQDESYVVEAESGGTRYRTEYRFAGEGDGTNLSMTFEGTPLSFGARMVNLVGAPFVGAAKKAMHQDLVDLKQACEGA